MKTTMIYLLFLLVFLLASPAWAATYWVRPTGTMSGCTASDTAPGADSGYKATIAAGLACLAGGDTLSIRAGTYSEGIAASQVPNGTAGAYTVVQAHQTEIVTLSPLSASGEALNFISDGANHQYIRFRGDDTAKNLVLEADGNVVQLGGGSNGGTIQFIELRGLEMKGKGASAGNIVNMGWNPAVSNITLQYCKLHNNAGINTEHGIYLTGSTAAGNHLVEYCEIYNITGFGIHQYAAGGGPISNNTYRFNWVHNFGTNSAAATGILVQDGTGNKVYGNLVTDGQSTSNDGSRGIEVAEDALVYNNTVNAMEWKGISVKAAGTAVQLKNNIITNVTDVALQIENGGSGTTLATNFCGSAHANCALNGNPLYVNPGANNYHLQSGSPAKDAGTDLGSPFNVDYDGISRPQGSAWDIGAYEFVVSGQKLQAPGKLTITGKVTVQ